MYLSLVQVFGPVLQCLNADSVDDAIALINQNPYGNGTAIFTRSGAIARKFVHEVAKLQILSKAVRFLSLNCHVLA